ncbi:nitric oxide synthase oxygenase [Pseudonocardia sp. D17]|uniref:nitric oxide synthase oxygenase n=1 Tax=Pseudonocardia sp. D17 TaxID=882661 RepID=UPI002B3F0BCF|nr:nitric oxide synthase oxygenase [Pseudonocardia sp. D17]
MTAAVGGQRSSDGPPETDAVLVPQQHCPMTGRGRPDAGTPDTGPRPVDPDEALEFLEQFHAEQPDAAGERYERRREAVLEEIASTGTYRHTSRELAFGAQVAWRNSARCIGRLYWKTLHVRDRRHLTAPSDVAAECIEHLREATRGGRIRSTITVFAPDVPERPGPRIHNEQLIRYAGHRLPDGIVRGDPRLADFTDLVERLGWRRPEPRGRFDVLPLLVSGPDGRPQLFDLPEDAVLEVPLTHPDLAWFADLRLRWHAVPAISNMPLVVGGVRYPAAPFNGWYLNTEIGARNLADDDRYDLLPAVARRMGLDTSSVRTLWRDRALVELTRAVQHSFDAAGVTMADHHTESERFLIHVEKEEKAGRSCPADWTWIVPPLSGGQTKVFHRYYDDPRPDERPAFLPPGADPLLDPPTAG